MADCLIALGSNLGDRAEHLRQAFAALAELPQSTLVARSPAYESAPIGGPAGQGDFLNVAALLATSLSPTRLFTELQRIESTAGRTPGQRWAVRPLDLDLAIYDGICQSTSQLTLPHPRMVYRRFVLKPAAEIAPWLVHSESGWTVGRLLRHLDVAGNDVVVATDSAEQTKEWIDQLRRRLEQDRNQQSHRPEIVAWTAIPNPAESCPKLILATSGAAGGDLHQRRKMLKLPATGPVAWIGLDATLDPLDEGAAAIEAMWPVS
jgi:2-amino-4-hydroxy-6-hydroxymethyldihydropteridine diphosphokinase